jgi:hypothetical protein
MRYIETPHIYITIASIALINAFGSTSTFLISS